MSKILVIEDNAEVRENLCEILELSGYDAVPAANGKEGVQRAISDSPDLILCDVMMPELDGFGVLKILGNNANTHGIPFIFLTAKAEKSDFRKGMGLGADDYITKPFDDTELLEAVEMRLHKSEKVRTAFDRSEEGLQRFFSEARAHEEFDKLSSDREVRMYGQKEYIYQEGQLARWLFFIVSGKVKRYKSNDFGKELITSIHKPGEFFGHFTLIRDGRYQDNAVALDNSEIRLIPKEDFSLLLFNNRDFSAQFIKMIAKDESHTQQQLIDLAYSSVRKKVANAILNFAERAGVKDKNARLEFEVSRDDLAAMAGTAKETLIRTLSDFKAEGMIEVNGSLIRILDEDGLEGMPQ